MATWLASELWDARSAIEWSDGLSVNVLWADQLVTVLWVDQLAIALSDDRLVTESLVGLWVTVLWADPLVIVLLDDQLAIGWLVRLSVRPSSAPT